MTAIPIDQPVAVIGAGTMGAGIAQVAAAAGHAVVLLDIADGAAQKGKQGIRAGLEKLILRGKKSQVEVDALLNKITPTASFNNIKDCRLVVEAIVENIEVKRKVLADIESLCDESTIIASNTSSISISAIAADAARPDKVVGMHFFNPAAILKLVEVVSGLQTSASVAQTVFDTASSWGKHPVHAKSTPGFIVNRVARPFYAEALRSLNEQVTSVATIDTLMRSCGGFKMGPLQLTDLIGQDINSAVTESVYNAFYQDSRFLPSVLQADMVSAGLLGRKTGRGFYDYSKSAATADAEIQSGYSNELEPIKIIGEIAAQNNLVELMTDKGLSFESDDSGLPCINVGAAMIQLSDGRTATQRAADQNTPNLVLVDYVGDYKQASHIALSVCDQAASDNSTAAALTSATAFFQALGKDVCVIKDVPGMLVLRTVCMLINEACDAVNQGVCSEDDVDVAMQSGVAYPKGLIAWGHELHYAFVNRVLKNIQTAYGEERYRVSPLLERKGVVELQRKSIEEIS